MALALAAGWPAGAAAAGVAPHRTGGTAPRQAAAEARHCRGTDAPPDQASADRSRAALLCLINRYRRSHHRRALRANRVLTQAAAGYTAAMVNLRFFSHVGPGGQTLVSRLRRSGYLHSGGTWSIGENLAWGTGPFVTPSQVFASWRRSPGHRANMLATQFRDAGIGLALVTPSGQAGATYAIELGERR